jgi:hypothetical protein
MSDLSISQLPELPPSGITNNVEYVVALGGTTYKIKNDSIFPLPGVYGLFSQTGDSAVISGTTVESTLIDGGLGSLLISADTFMVGDTFIANFAGVLSSANNETIRIRVKADSILLLDSGLQTLPSTTNDVWTLTIKFVIRQIGGPGVASLVSLGTFHYTKKNNADVQGFSFETVNTTTFDTTISNTLDVTAQWGSSNASNSIYSNIFILNKHY